MRKMLIAIFVLIFQFSCYCTGQIPNLTAGSCPGTSSGFGFSSDGIQNYESLVTRFSNCTTVVGNLEILGLEIDEIDLSFLQNIEVVTGYVLIGFNFITTFSLRNLRVIRGQELFEDRYALYIYGNFNNGKPSQHMKNLRLNSLNHIVQGDVYISRNFICYIDTIEWSDMFDGNQTVEIREFNGNITAAVKKVVEMHSEECGVCDSSCYRKSCWAEGPSNCQTFTKLICNAACHGSRCSGPGVLDCCNSECAGGCNGTSTMDCKVCLNVNNSGVCQKHCPPEFVLDKRRNRLVSNPHHKFQYGDHCVRECPDNLLVEKNLCVKSCRVTFHNDGNGRCVACEGGVCDKECFGVQHHDGPLSNHDSVNALNIHHYEGCNIIKGNLIFLSQAFTGDSAMQIPPMNSSALKVFTSLKKISGFLKIVSWPEDSHNFSVFQNLEQIGGVDLFNDLVALAIYTTKNSSSLDQITSLGFRSLKSIDHGNVWIDRLNNLCYAQLVDWQKLLLHHLTTARYRFKNGVKVDRNKLNCSTVRCHSFCNEDGCWGPGPAQCLKCNQTKFSYKGTCYEECEADMGLYTIPGVQECQTCHPECKTCFGPGPQNCSACNNYDDNGTCVSRCPLEKYGDSSGKCLPCNDACFKKEDEYVCGGPEAIRGPEGCTSCNFALAIRGLLVLRCLPLNATCPEGHHVLDNIPSIKHTCVPCYEGCRECRGSKAEDCLHTIPLSGKSLASAVSIPTVAFIIFIVLFVPCCLHRRRQKRKHVVSMTELGLCGSPEINSDLKTLLMEPMTPSGVPPNQAHLRIVKDDELKITKLLGSGAFGTVHKGFWTPDISKEKVTVPVAIKVLRDDSSQMASNELLDEACLMASCQHPYLVRLLGICLSQKIMLVTQLMPLGNLLDFVRNNKDNIGSQYLLNWSLQIAKGMCYLSEEKHLVHRDLAARNVLVRSPHHVRITDFGLAKLLDVKEDVYRAEGGKMPIKWLALESIQHRIFTQKSDVWSFGVTMWELMTFGKRPYENVQAKEVFSLLERGERLSQPPICTIDIYMLLIKCWTVDAEARPTFRELAEELSRMARDPQRYIVIANEECHSALPSPSPSEILSDLKNEMNENHFHIADADDYFFNSARRIGMNGFSLQPVPATVPWKRQNQSLSSTSSQNFLLGNRDSGRSQRNRNSAFGHGRGQRSDSVVTEATNLSENGFSPSKKPFDESSLFTPHTNQDEVLLGVGGDARFFSRRPSSEDSPNTGTFSDAFDVFGPPTPKRLEDVAEIDDCNSSGSLPHSTRAREDSTTLRYSADPVALLRQETQPNVYLDPSEFPASPLTFNSSLHYQSASESALTNPEYDASFQGFAAISKDTEGYEIPIASNKDEVDYENLRTATEIIENNVDNLSNGPFQSDESTTSAKIDSDSGSPSDDEVEERKTSSVVNPNYHWLSNGDIHDNSQPDYENVGFNTDVSPFSLIEDDIFTSVIKANGQCKPNNNNKNERTYSEPDSGVGIEVGVDNILYHKIGPERNV